MIKRVLVVGFGSIAKRHIRIIKKLLPKSEIAVLRKSNLPCSEAEINSKNCFSNFEQALKFNPDIAIIASPASNHLEAVKILSTHKVNLFIEKPLAENKINAKQIFELCNVNRINAFLGYNLRFHDSIIEFNNLIKSGITGNIYSVESRVGQYLPDWRPGNDYKKSVSSSKLLGGGVLRELSHEIDYLSWIFGPFDWVSGNLGKVSSLKIDVEDNAKVVFGYNSSYSNLPTIYLGLDFLRQDTKRECEVIGSLGTLIWNGVDHSVKFFSKGKKKWKVLFKSNPDTDYSYEKELNYFINQLLQGKSDLSSISSGLKIVSLVESIEKSNKLQKRIYLNE